ncbi:16S rRNA (uracil(1498)-N(3))-methyltransferase [Pedobacter deserti]|uniref:16S rRNA (uracil(1498)-N(3))-methyltransferase n=1 Tax=Pedobacter deserti TaxID=2817382 RepID=UPI002109620F|nr:16S rRNA (uracil(1498)-N(3))-methyltransferase [Pedobacter sp. SYSU D00382]
MHVFYTPDINSDQYVLNEEESRHCIKVLRLVRGSVVHLVDGRGGLYTAEISSLSQRNVHLHILESKQNHQQRNHHLHIAVAPTKNIDRLEWFLEKATEIGIDEITPVICSRSERKVVKHDRLLKVITSAVKQSLQAYHPILNAQASLTDFLRSDISSAVDGNLKQRKLIAHCEQDSEKAYISQLCRPYERYTILIGPEGDFASSEIELARNKGYAPVSLGSSRLRTETAALAACFEINYLNR